MAAAGRIQRSRAEISTTTGVAGTAKASTNVGNR